MKTELFVIYDSIFNSVFAGQVVAPLQKRIQDGTADRAIIISFEQNLPKALQYAKKFTTDRISLFLIKKSPFLGSFFLRWDARKLKKMLTHQSFSTLTARGPLAGYIVAHATTLPFIVQARGLAADEYRYAHDATSWPYSWLHEWRAQQYEAIERTIYGQLTCNRTIQIQAVSNALRDHLISYFDAPASKTVVSDHDVPPPIPTEQLKQWRTATRIKLHIAPTAQVYVYCGSAHPCQCADVSIDFFCKKYRENNRSFLLILSTDHERFKEIIAQYQLPKNSYHITRVPHADIYRYLAAADAGLLFRRQHIINWVSRPTKALEYRAVGLEIIHNNTIAMLQKSV